MENLSVIKLSTNRWHFKLCAYVYGEKFIKFNLDLYLYFWALIGAFVIVLFKAPIKWIVKTFSTEDC